MKALLTLLATAACALAIIAGVGALLPQSHTAMGSSQFNKKPQVVWDAIAGPQSWRSNIKRVENVPSRDGHRTWKEIDSRGRSVTYEAIEETAPYRLVTRIVDSEVSYGGIWIYEIAPNPDGCVLQITEDGEIYNPISRFLARFVFGYSSIVEGVLNALHAKLGDARANGS